MARDDAIDEIEEAARNEQEPPESQLALREGEPRRGARDEGPATVIRSGLTGRQKRKGKSVWIQPSIRWPSLP